MKLLASFFYLSHIPYAIFINFRFKGTGFLGSLIGGVLYFIFKPSVGFSIFFVLISIVISGFALKSYGNNDDPRVIIDEISGFMLSLSIFNLSPVFSFIVFRIVDTNKFFFKFIEELPFGIGCVMDDVISGVVTSLITFFLYNMLWWLRS